MRLCSFCYCSHTFWSPKLRFFFLSLVFCTSIFSEHSQPSLNIFFFPFCMKLRTTGNLVKCSNHSSLTMKSSYLDFCCFLVSKLILGEKRKAGKWPVFIVRGLAIFGREPKCQLEASWAQSFVLSKHIQDQFFFSFFWERSQDSSISHTLDEHHYHFSLNKG